MFENEVLKVIECNPKLSKVTPQTALRFFRDRKFNPKQTIAYIEKNQVQNYQIILINCRVTLIYKYRNGGNKWTLIQSMFLTYTNNCALAKFKNPFFH